MMKTSYRLMTESEIKQIHKGDTLYLDAEFIHPLHPVMLTLILKMVSNNGLLKILKAISME